MQDFKEALEILEKSKEFKEWKKKNPEDYLSYALMIVDEKDTDWKIGYCNKQNKVTSFNVGNRIVMEPEDKVLQKEKKGIKEIDLGKAKLSMADAVTVAVNLQKEEFVTESPQKIIAILQTLDIGQIWNITFFTQSFNTLNIKVKSENGRILEKKIQPLFGMDK